MNCHIFVENEKYIEAKELYEKVLSEYKDRETVIESLKGLVRVFVALGEYKRARDYNQRILSLDKTNYFALQQEAVILYKLESKNPQIIGI